jgi:hypothetical protein
MDKGGKINSKEREKNGKTECMENVQQDRNEKTGRYSQGIQAVS